MSTALEIELTQELLTQQQKYWKVPSVTGVVGCVNASVGNTKTEFVTIKQDGEFIVRLMTISCLGPTDINGRVPVAVPDTQTAFPSGKASASGVDLANRGIMVKLTDDGSGRTLTDNFVPVELFASPGYGNFMREAFPMRYVFRKEAKLRIDIINNDTSVLSGGADAYHQYSFALIGEKYVGVKLDG